MNSKIAKTHKRVACYDRDLEASISITISDIKRFVEFGKSRSGSNSSCSSYSNFSSSELQPKEWELCLYIEDKYYRSLTVSVKRIKSSPAEITDGSLTVTHPSSNAVKDCARIGHVMCGENVVFQDTRSSRVRAKWDIRENVFRDNDARSSRCDDGIELRRDAGGVLKIDVYLAYSVPVKDEEVIYCDLPTPERLTTAISVAYEDLFREGVATDFSFLVEGEEIKAHEAILTARLPYFGKMMSSGMIESETKSVKIEETDPATFKRMLKYVYCGLLPDDLDSDASKLLPLADRFELPELRQACLHWLEKGLTMSTVCDTLITADLYNCAGLKKKCLERLSCWKSSMSEEAMTGLLSYPRLLMDLVKIC